MKRRLALLTLALLAMLALVASNQLLDLRHTSHALQGLMRQGLPFYSSLQKDGIASDYLPSLYVLVSFGLLPAWGLEALFKLDSCSYFSGTTCIAESISLKISVLLLAALWIRQGTRFVNGFSRSTSPSLRPLAGLMLLPPVLYAWLLFGSYDGLGAFTTLIGGGLYFGAGGQANPRQNPGHGRALLGLVLVALGVGAKLFPLPLFLATGLAFGRLNRRMLVGVAGVLVATGLQIALSLSYGGEPLRILMRKASESAYHGVYNIEIALAMTAIFTAWLVRLWILKGPNPAAGALLALGSYSLTFPAIEWHSQWNIYYGISLFACLALIPLSQRKTRITWNIIAIQGVLLLISAQYLAYNADITMTTSALFRGLIPSLYELAPKAIQAPINLSFYGYSLTQILLLAIISHSFLTSSATAGDRPSQSGINLADGQSFRLYPGYLFLGLWYLIAFGLWACSGNPSERFAASLQDLRPINNNMPHSLRVQYDSSFAPLQPSVVAPPQPAIAPSQQSTALLLQHNSALELPVPAIPAGPNPIRMVGLVLKRQEKVTDGTVHVCLTGSPPPVTTDPHAPSAPCLAKGLLPLAQSAANGTSFVRLEPPIAVDRVRGLTLQVTLRPPNGPAPQLDVNSRGQPRILLFSGRGPAPGVSPPG
jgi:hypothetical protein